MAAPANAEDESRDRARNQCGQLLTESFLFINTDPGIGPDRKRYAPYPQIFTLIASMNTTGYTDSSGRLHHSVISRSPCGPVHVGEVRGAPCHQERGQQWRHP
jgi:hypothetical protein